MCTAEEAIILFRCLFLKFLLTSDRCREKSQHSKSIAQILELYKTRNGCINFIFFYSYQKIIGKERGSRELRYLSIRQQP